MALSLAFIVIIHAVNIYDPLVVLSRVTLYLNNVLIGSSLNLCLTVTTSVEDQSLFLLRDARVLGNLIFCTEYLMLGR